MKEGHERTFTVHNLYDDGEMYSTDGYRPEESGSAMLYFNPDRKTAKLAIMAGADAEIWTEREGPIVAMRGLAITWLVECCEAADAGRGPSLDVLGNVGAAQAAARWD